MTISNYQEALNNVKHFYQTLTPETLTMIDTVYIRDAFFKDPFNEVRGIEAISGIFRRMFEELDEPRFVITHSILQDDHAFLTWQFLFRLKRWNRHEQSIIGSSHIEFAYDGRVAYHRDYWDAAGEVYAKLPVIGWLMRKLAQALG